MIYRYLFEVIRSETVTVIIAVGDKLQGPVKSDVKNNDGVVIGARYAGTLDAKCMEDAITAFKKVYEEHTQ